MRHAVLNLALCVLCAAPAVAGALAVAEERPLADGQALHVRVEAGSVQVRAGEAGKVRLQAELAPGQRVVWREAPDRLALIVDDPERFTPRPSEMSVTVPPSARLVLHLGRAALDLQGVEAVRLVVRCGAEARIAGAFETVDVAVDGPVDLRLEEASRSVRAEGTEVDLVARGGVDAVAVDARRGAATLALNRPRRVRATSVSGPITLRLGESSGADVMLDSLSGDLRVELSGPWPGVIVPRLGRGSFEVPDVMADKVAPKADPAGEGGRLVLSSTSGNARIAVRPPPP